MHHTHSHGVCVNAHHTSYPEAVRLTRNARKHGFTGDEVRRVLDAVLCSVAQQAPTRGVLHIGLAPNRDLVEVVVVPGAPPVVVHAMRLRPANYHHLGRLRTSPPSVTAGCDGDDAAGADVPWPTTGSSRLMTCGVAAHRGVRAGDGRV